MSPRHFPSRGRGAPPGRLPSLGGVEGRPVETADIAVPAAHCEIVYEIPIDRWPTVETEPESLECAA